MRARSRVLSAVMAVALTSTMAAGCGGEEGAEASTVITYWASQQSPSIERDKEILRPELEKFTEQTGIEVELEVIPFTDLLNRILTATTSGQGPDVLNIGNTWSPSLQATGALAEWDEEMLERIGGADRFEPVTLETAGAEGRPAASVPLYTKVFQLYYNKQLFKEAGIQEPPATRDDLVTVGQELTKDTDGDGEPDQWGLGVRGQAFTTALHYAYILGSARGAEFFPDGEPAFESADAVEGIDQLLSWMGEDKIVNPSDAANADWADVYEAFSKDRVGMMLVQTLGQTLKDYGLTDDDYGVAPMPALTPGGDEVASFVGGTNVAVFKDSDNMDGAVDLVEFLTSAPEQVALNKAYGTIPPVTDAQDAAFDTPEAEIALDTLRSRAIPLPRVPEEAQFETLVGEAVVSWLADTATGDQPSEADIAAELGALSERVEAGG
jgi:multiple sugar transport system substrate-binding protein